MAAPKETIVAAIEEKRPLVLLLGQDAWRENGQEDPVLSKAIEHLQRNESRQTGWRQLLDGPPLQPTFHEWLAERFERRVAPDWLRVLGKIPWSAVFTSSLDPTLKTLFSERQRPELVLTSAEMPPAVRSRNRPPIYHLFGHAASLDPKARPPLSRDELNTRRFNDAMPLLGRLLDTATPLGLILVDGVGAERDWMRINDLLGAVGNAGQQQVIWFKGRMTSLPEDEDFLSAVTASRLSIVEDRLSTVIAELLAVQRLADLLAPEPEESGRITLDATHFIEVSPEERLQVEAVASVVDDAWTAPPAPLGREAEHVAFHRFHGEPGNARSLVEGVRRGFAIKRDYENLLQERINKAIEKHANVTTPLILHGQSATGKSIALARVAESVRRKAKSVAVLYSKTRIPRPYEVAPFCGSAESAGAKATLIICDANQDVRPYADLLSGLRSRGHRVVVLGSRYRFADVKEAHPHEAIEAPHILSAGERDSLASLLKRFTDQQVPAELLKDNHILSFLYRALPPVRYQIGSGLSSEAQSTEHMVREHRAKYLAKPQPTLMAQRLSEAGIRNTDLFNARQQRAIEADGAAAKIIDLVMAAGSLGCPVPFNLLFRLTAEGRSMSSPMEVAEIFGGLDLFRWLTDEENNELLVSARLALEAELICRRRLGGAAREAECIVELVGAVRSIGVERDHERRFLFRTLEQVGPNGPRGTRYRSAYAHIAKALTELRTHYGVKDASVVLQESAFRRHAVRENLVEHDERMGVVPFTLAYPPPRQAPAYNFFV